MNQHLLGAIAGSGAPVSISRAPARSLARLLPRLLFVVGPGVLVMLGENDGPSMLAYSVTGATYGIGFFVPFIVLTFVMAYVVQEMTVRVGIASRRGHAELIYERFGPYWGTFALGNLLIGNALTLVTEFIAIRAGAAYFDIPPVVAVGASAAFIVVALATRNYFTWERAAVVLALGNLLFVPAASLAHPDLHGVASALATWAPVPRGNGAFLTLLLANVGATITPWMLFFQQGAVIDKGLTRADLSRGRFDTALGAGVAALVAVATVVATTPLFAHHIDVSSFSGGADFAAALRPYLGGAGAALFALAMIEAGLLAAMTISTSSAYAAGEVWRSRKNARSGFETGPSFFITAAASVAIAASFTLIPHVPLLEIAILVNVAATLLMPPALILLLLLANDAELMGPLANSVRQNVASMAVAVLVVGLGVIYGAVAVCNFLQVKL